MDSKKINYEAVLDDLEAEKDGIQAAIDGINKMLERTIGSALKPDSFLGMDLSEGVKILLAISGKPLDTPQLAERLKKYGFKTKAKYLINCINANLTRYSKHTSDILRLPNTKEWALSKWYSDLNISQTLSAKPNGDGTETQNGSSIETDEVNAVLDQ